MAGILRLDELQNGAGQSVVQLNADGTMTPSVGIQLPYYGNNDKPANPQVGLLIFNTALQTVEMWNGATWAIVFSSGIGKSAAVPATDAAQILASDPSAANGLYWLKPSTYTGVPVEVYIDFDGSVSGINDSGPWIRLRYSQDYYSRGDAWRGKSGLSDPANESTTAFSGEFTWEQPEGFIDSLLDGSTEVRCRFESWGYGSVGWTYGSGYMQARGFNGTNYTRWNGSQDICGKDYTRPSGMSHSVTSINGPFDNPTSRNTDPTDNNDSTWRVGVFYFRNTNASNKILPIRGIYNADVDGGSEQRYFPFRTPEAGQGASDIWVK